MTQTVNPDTGARIKESFALQSMMTSAGAELVSVEEGRVVISANVGEGFGQQAGFIHGGLVFALGDSAAGYSALSVMPSGVEVMTVEMKINFLAPASGRLRAEGRVIKRGRRLVVVASDVWSENEKGERKQIAVLQGTMIPVETT